MKYQTQKESDCPEFDLKAFMRIHGLSYRKVAKITGLDPSYVYRLTKGMYVMSYETAKKFFIALREYDKENPTVNFAGLPLF